MFFASTTLLISRALFNEAMTCGDIYEADSVGKDWGFKNELIQNLKGDKLFPPKKIDDKNMWQCWFGTQVSPDERISHLKRAAGEVAA